MTDFTLIKDLIINNNEKLYLHLKKLKCDFYLNNFIHKLLIGLFLDGISDIYQLIIWDSFILEGDIILFKAVYGIIKIISKDILETNEIEEIYNIFQKKIYQYDNTVKLIYFLIFKKYDFDHEEINNYRKIILPQIIKEIKNNNCINELNEEEDLECDLDWPFCLKDYNYRSEIIEFICLRQLEKPIIIEDYYNNCFPYEKNKEKKEKDEIDYYSETCIQRRKHICDSQIESIKSILRERNKDEFNILLYQSQRKKTYTSYSSSLSGRITQHKNNTNFNKIIIGVEKENIIHMSKQKIEEIDKDIENIFD